MCKSSAPSIKKAPPPPPPLPDLQQEQMAPILQSDPRRQQSARKGISAFRRDLTIPGQSNGYGGLNIPQ